jgi:hypothetical protein
MFDSLLEGQRMPDPYHAPAARPEMSAPVRVQLDMPAEKVAALDELARAAGLATRKELFSNALTLLDWAVQQVQRGRTIASVDDNEGRMIELHMPFLNALAERRP